MAKAGLDIIRDVGKGLTQVVVGLLLLQGVVAIPLLGGLNVWLGWAIAIVGGYDFIVSFK